MYVDVEIDPRSAASTPLVLANKSAGSKTGQPRGKAPKGMVWNMVAQAYEPDPYFQPILKRANSLYVGVYPWSYDKAVSEKGKYAGKDKWRMKITLDTSKGRIFEGPFDTEEEVRRC